MSNRWQVDEHGCHVITGKHCYIWIDARQSYCDRGNWLAHIEVTTRDVRELQIDHQDGWPRYYFDLDRAKAECEAWLAKRGET